MKPPEKPNQVSAVPPSPSRGLRGVIFNMGWLLFQKGFLILLGLVATAWVSRYLQAEQLGMISAATAIVTYFGFLSSGVDTAIMARAILHEPHREGAIMGGVTIFLAFLGGVSWVLLIVYVGVFKGFASTGAWLTLIVGCKLLLSFPAPLGVWLYSREKLKYTVLANTAASTVLRFYQLLVVVMRGNVFALVWAESISLLVNGGYCYWAYKRVGGAFRYWTYSLRDGFEIWKKSLPALIASSLFLLLLKLDVLMLERFRSNVEVGYFTAAASLSESLYFLTNLLALPLGPRILLAFKQDPKRYKDLQGVYFKVSALLGWICALILSVGSPWIVKVVFGDGFTSSASVLQIHAFMLLACFLGSAHGLFMTAESKLQYMAMNLGVALGVNFLVNLWIIPRLGAEGSAYATVVGVAVAYVLMPCVWPETRALGLMGLKSLLLPLPSWKKLRASL